MFANRLAVCVSGVCLTLLAGCASLDQFGGLFALESDAAGKDRVVTGSLEAVAKSTEANLTQMGLQAVSTRKGDAIHVAARTKHGAEFTVVLTREASQVGEQTRVHLEWKGSRDDQTSFQLMSRLDTVARK